MFAGPNAKVEPIDQAYRTTIFVISHFWQRCVSRAYICASTHLLTFNTFWNQVPRASTGAFQDVLPSGHPAVKVTHSARTRARESLELTCLSSRAVETIVRRQIRCNNDEHEQSDTILFKPPRGAVG